VKNIYKKNGRKRFHENMESCLLLGERVLQLRESDHTWKKSSMFKRTRSFPFHVVMEWFLFHSKIVLRLIRKRSEPFQKLVELVSCRSFSERSESNSIKMRLPSLTAFRETPENGFLQPMNAFLTT
jgi:hypothetical protein